MLRRVLAALALMPLGACVSAEPPRTIGLTAVALAAATAPQELSARAANDPVAQLALSLTYAYGLQGAQADPEEARRWRERAIVPRRGYITTYTAGFDGRSSRVGLVPTTQSIITPADAALAERCAAGLAHRAVDLAALCGGERRAARLRRLWG